MLHLLCLSLVPLIAAQISLPLLPNPNFAASSGEGLLSAQLASWNITLGPLELDLNLALGDTLELNAQVKLLSTRGCKRRLDADCNDPRLALVKGYLQRLRLAGWDEHSDIDFSKPPFKFIKLDLDLFEHLSPRHGFEPRDTERGLLEMMGVKAVTLDMVPQISLGKGWGEAENVARGERGDTEWYTYVTIGTPPQSVPILPDTGSSDMFVYANSCTSCFLANHSSFDPLSSSTFANGSSAFELDYADGSGATGYVGSDLVAFGQNGEVKTQMVVGLATEAHGRTFRSSGRSGILGLGLDHMVNMDGGSTLFSRLIKSGQIQDPYLSIRYEKGRKSQGVTTQEGGGSYLFGGMEGRYIRGGRAGLSWNKGSSLNYWGFPLEDIAMGLVSTMLADRGTPRKAIIDTGTSLIITSDHAAQAIHALIDGSLQAKSGVWYIPCTVAFPRTPNLFFTIGGRRYGVPIEDLAWKRSEFLSGMCISGVQGGMPHFTVLGAMFIKNHYVVLSYENEGQPYVGLGDRSDIPLIL